MKVSVLMITYNQEKYIAQALDSVLMQDVAFDYEIVIGEDCSSDATRAIVLDYQNRYPGKIRTLLPGKNIGMLQNFAQTYYACDGEYVAMLEGDDFWTCSTKLQKQADFLDRSPESALCFHPTELLQEGQSHAPDHRHPLNCSEFSTIENLLEGNFIQTCSVMFRNKLFGDLPRWFFTGVIGDHPLHILNAAHGNIGYLDEVMGAYRIHAEGVWSMQMEKNYVRNYRAAIKMYQDLDVHFDRKFHRTINKRIFRHELALFEWHVKHKEYHLALNQAVKLVCGYPLLLSEGFLKSAPKMLKKLKS